MTEYTCTENFYDMQTGRRVKSTVTTLEPRIGLTQKKTYLETNGERWLHSVESIISVENRKCYSYKEFDRNGRKLLEEQINADGTSNSLVFDRRTGKPMVGIVGVKQPTRQQFGISTIRSISQILLELVRISA